MGPAGLRRHRRSCPALRGTRVLRSRPAVEGLPADRVRGPRPRRKSGMSGTRVILWRHGNTDWNAEHRVQGQTDVPLNDFGVRQAAAAAVRLAARKPTLLLSS